MTIIFTKDYLADLYSLGTCKDKQHRFQPQIVKKYVRTINVMMSALNTQELARMIGLHFEELKGDKKGYCSVRVNDQYRVEFTTETKEGEQIATICNITELSNHYN